MPDETTILSLPLIMPSQAQKHVTHNEALRILDVAVQLAVTNRTRTTAPASPLLGDRYIVAANPTGTWAGKDHAIAAFTEEGWYFFPPKPGWQAFVLAEGAVALFDGTGWDIPTALPLSPDLLGVNATANATNRLTVASDATLFTHDGQGHQMKVNKAASTDTASLLFQSNFVGMAEMGLAGTNDFAIKVSADGTVFQTALQADAATGAVTLGQGVQVAPGTAAAPGLAIAGDANSGIFSPAANQIGLATAGAQRALLTSTGLTLNVPLQGAAAVAGEADALPDLGLLVPTTMASSLVYKGRLTSGSLNTLYEPGIYRIETAADAAAIANVPGVVSGGILEVMSPDAVTARGSAALVIQRYTMRVGATAVPRVYVRQNATKPTATWGAWHQIYSTATVVGQVTQSGGLPTGGIIERASNANGEYVRFADGTQICTRINLSAANASTALGSLFRSADVSWTFPAAFAAAPVVTGNPDNSDCWLTNAVPSVSAVVVRVLAGATKTTAITIRAMAVGRWF